MNARRKFFFLSGKGGSPAPVGLLNTAAGDGAAFAISLRMLNADLIGQDAIEVLRTANNDFDRFPLLATGVDTAAIASFCGASDSVVGWMLDQSGNGRDAVQTALNSAPKIYDSATGIVTKNGKPSLSFNGTSQFFNRITAATVDVRSFIFVGTGTGNDGNGGSIGSLMGEGGQFPDLIGTGDLSGALSNESVFYFNGDSTDVPDDVLATNYALGDDEQFIGHWLFDTPGNGAIRVNGEQANLIANDVSARSMDMVLGKRLGLEAYFSKLMQEVIIFGNDKTVVAPQIDTEIKTYYGIS